MRHRGDRSERGAALVESAIVIGVIMMLAVGSVEYGMAFRDFLGVAAASREAVRVGASAGADPTADCRILESAASALFSTSGDEVLSVEIAKRDPSTGVDGSPNAYRPFDPDLDDPSSLVCGAWFQTNNAWPPTSRDDQGADRDWVVVTVTYRHAWVTGFLWWNGTVDWTNETSMRIEPETF